MRNPNNYTQAQRRLGGLNRPKREERFEEVIARFRADRKGHVVAEGVTYSAQGESHWQVRHSTAHADQFDVLADGRRITRGGPRQLPTPWIRKKARAAKEQNATYAAIGVNTDDER
jgi:hypothetical protein